MRDANADGKTEHGQAVKDMADEVNIDSLRRTMGLDGMGGGCKTKQCWKTDTASLL